MSLKYIFGGPGSGKTTKCFEEIFDHSQKGAEKLIYIVPEQFSLVAEKNLIDLFPGKSVISAQVLSFERLAYHIFSEKGIRNPKILDPMGKSMIIRKIIHENSKRFKYYKNILVTAGFVNNICATIKEFHQYGVDVENIKSDTEETVFDYKIHDIKLIYREYQKQIQKDYVCVDETLDLLSESIESSVFLENAMVWIDNFTGFTPQEYKVIKKLLSKTEAVSICIGIKSKEISYVDVELHDHAIEAKTTINKLTALARDEKIHIEKPVLLKDSHRFVNSPELLFLEENFYARNKTAYEGENSRVRVSKFPNKYIEIENTATEIVNLVREKDYRYSDIAILTGEISSYSAVIRNVFSSYGIPFFIDERSSVSAHPLVEFINSLFEIILKSWSYESVFRLLKTGFSSLENYDLDLLENYAIAYGIRGGKWKDSGWKYGFGEKGSFDKEKIYAARAYVYEFISKFTLGLTPKAKISVSDLCFRLFKYLEEIQAALELEKLCMEALKDGNMQLYREHSGIWNTVMEVLEKMVDIFGDEIVTVEEFASILETGFSSCTMGIIPPARDQITIGDIYRSRLNEIKVLFVIGATNDVFPKKHEDFGILNDNDKDRLSESGVEISPKSIFLVHLNQYLAYSIVTKASDYLYIYCPENNLDGKAIVASSIMAKINALVPSGFEENGEPMISVAEAMVKNAGQAISKLKTGKKTDEFEQALLKWFSQSHEYSKYIEKMKYNFEESANKRLNSDVLESLYSENIQTSITRLERFTGCPFSYFVDYNLKAKEREDYEVSRIDLGNIFHKVLEEFSKYVEIKNIKWENLEYEIIEDMVEDIFTKLLVSADSDIFVNDKRSGYILERIKRISAKSLWALSRHITAGDFKPYGSEIDFGISSPLTGIRIEINEKHHFTLTGRIDRIDILDSNGNSYVKIIDYKSGSKKIDFTDIYYGMQLQLLIYIKALTEKGETLLNLDKKPNPGGVLYFKLDDPMAKYSAGMAAEDIQDEILKEFAMTGLVLDEKDVIEGIDKNIEKASAVIPVSKNSKGEYTSRSKILINKESFDDILKFTETTVKTIGSRILSGEIAPKPYKKGNNSGCGFCSYKSICGFEKAGKYNVLRTKTLEDLKNN